MITHWFVRTSIFVFVFIRYTDSHDINNQGGVNILKSVKKNQSLSENRTYTWFYKNINID